jgi:hypothetical protein
MGVVVMILRKKKTRTMNPMISDGADSKIGARHYRDRLCRRNAYFERAVMRRY